MKNLTLRRILILCFTIFISFPQLINSQKTATIYIGSPTSNPIEAHHFDNYKYIGSSVQKTFIKYECNPGKHLFWSRAFVKAPHKQVEAFLELDVKAGETYYLKSDGNILKIGKTEDKISMINIFSKKILSFNLSLNKLDHNSYEQTLFKKRINKKKPTLLSSKDYKKIKKNYNIDLLKNQSLKAYRNPKKVVVSNNIKKGVINNAFILQNTLIYLSTSPQKNKEAIKIISDIIKEKGDANDYDLNALIKSKSAKQTGSLKTKTHLATTTTTTTDVNVTKKPKVKPSLYSNKREQIFNEIKKGKNLEVSKNDVATIIKVNSNLGNKKKKKLSKTQSSDNSNILKYRRSSLYTLMIKNNSRKYSKDIINAFGNAPLLEKFNNQNIGPYLININGEVKDQSNNIDNYFNTNDVAKKLVAKWFNRNNKGEFNMDLIAKRGAYDASALDISIAQNTERGMALLADAGEELISNTFVIINDYKFTNKAEVAKKVGGFLKLVKGVSSYIPGAENITNVASYAQVGVGVVGKGYVIKTTSYLYQLVWNDEIASIFYNDCWVDKDNFDVQKKNNFEKSNDFRLKLIGFETAWADIQSTGFSKKSDKDLIKVSTVKATNKAIAKLQRKFEAFRTKTPLLSGSPISAKIGLKEGLEKGDKFEVLEQVLDKNGKTTYKRVGVVKVDKRQIWDNRYSAGEENNSQLDYTVFTGSKNKYFAGMLIRQIN